MLSRENRNKVCMSGLYRHAPVKEWRGKMYEGNLYHCCNWTFKPLVQHDGSIHMADTYWGCAGGLYVELTDENIDSFELICDLNDVFDVGERPPEDYEEKDVFRVAIDSGGINHKHYFVRKDAKPSLALKLERLEKERDFALRQVEYYNRSIETIKEQLTKEPNATYVLD